MSRRSDLPYGCEYADGLYSRVSVDYDSDSLTARYSADSFDNGYLSSHYTGRIRHREGERGGYSEQIHDREPWIPRRDGYGSSREHRTRSFADGVPTSSRGTYHYSSHLSRGYDSGNSRNMSPPRRGWSSFDDRYSSRDDDHYGSRYDGRYSSRSDGRYGSRNDDRNSSRGDDSYTSRDGDRYSSRDGNSYSSRDSRRSFEDRDRDSSRYDYDSRRDSDCGSSRHSRGDLDDDLYADRRSGADSSRGYSADYGRRSPPIYSGRGSPRSSRMSDYGGRDDYRSSSPGMMSNRGTYGGSVASGRGPSGRYHGWPAPYPESNSERSSLVD